MNLHFKSPGEKPGIYPIAARGKDLKYLSFQIVELGAPLKQYTFETGDEEISLNFYTGPTQVTAEGAFGGWSADVPERHSIAEAGSMIYIPSHSKVTLKTLNGASRITVAGAESKRAVTPALLRGDSKNVGKDNWNRTVFTYIADNVPAEHLICGETVNQPGGWSSCPPHKHDRFAPPSEVPMEEIYYFQLEPRQGFGFMRVYTHSDDTDPFDNAYAVEHGDTVLIPRGYHPVVACPGYTLHYTWILAGEGRVYGAWSDDPQHSWIKQT
ncbi:MAG TPA: 5-deoxy-glucuronate isomerase [Bryobacteraceae bacterium]|nr:5-deoxy-glucuronate isomerase [Bryobacteraceae bacterium]